MEKQIKDLIDKAKKDQSFLRKLKHFATDSCMYEFASQLRELELKQFPESVAVKKEKKDAEMLSRTFGMVELNINERVAYIILKTVEGYKKKKGNFSIKDASYITETANELFL